MESEKIVSLLHIVWRHITMAEEALRALYEDPDDKLMQQAVILHAREVREARRAYRRANVQLLIDQEEGGKENESAK